VAIDRERYRSESLETWNRVAPGWGAKADWLANLTGPLNRWLLDGVEAGPGDTALELAAGPGELSFRLRELVGRAGRVVCSDFSPEMVEVAKRRGESNGVTGVEYRVLDAESMDLDDDSIDRAVCRWGYMLMSDPAAALAETRRVLKDDGRLAFAVWGDPQENPWASVPGGVLVERGHLEPPAPGAPGIFSMADPERIRHLVAGAGFTEPVVARVEFDYVAADFDDFWDLLNKTTGPLARVIERLDPSEVELTRAAIRERSGPFLGEDGSYRAPAVSLAVLAR
jgi:SAM-dependent methyltransferase